MIRLSPIARRMLGVVLIAGAMTGLAACAGTGRAGPAPMASAAAHVSAAAADPAPIVSGTMRRYQVRGRWYQPEEQPNYDQVGMASWYGDQFDGRPTATGERFDMHALTAAHRTLPLPGLVEVTNMANGRRVILRVNDRGPFVDDRIIDLSRGAAEALDMLSRGVGEVRVRYLGRAPRLGGGERLQRAQAAPPPPRASSPPLVETFWVQVADFADPAQARTVADRLGVTAQVQAATDQTRFRILAGPWSDANAAERARQTMVADGFAAARLIPGG